MLSSEFHLRDTSPDRFIPFLDVDLLAGVEWLSVKHAGKVSMIMLSIHLSVLPSDFSFFYFNHI